MQLQLRTNPPSIFTSTPGSLAPCVATYTFSIMPLTVMDAVTIKEFMDKMDSDLLQSLLRHDVSEHVIACLSQAYVPLSPI